jgi:hypothetical protein
MPAEGVAACVNDRKPVGLLESCAEGLSLAEGAPLREGAGERDVEPLEVTGVDAETLPEGGREALAEGELGAVGDPELDCPALREAEAPEGEELPRAVRERVAAPEDVPLPPLPEGLLRGEADGLGEEDGNAVAEGGAEVEGDEEPHGDGRGEAEAEPLAEAPPLGVGAAVEDVLPRPLRLEDVLPVGDALRPPLQLGDALPVGDALPPMLRLGEAQAEAFAARHPEYATMPVTADELPAGVVANAQGHVRTMPPMLAEQGGLDGFFVARFERNA